MRASFPGQRSVWNAIQAPSGENAPWRSRCVPSVSWRSAPPGSTRTRRWGRPESSKSSVAPSGERETVSWPRPSRAEGSRGDPAILPAAGSKGAMRTAVRTLRSTNAIRRPSADDGEVARPARRGRDRLRRAERTAGRGVEVDPPEVHRPAAGAREEERAAVRGPVRAPVDGRVVERRRTAAVSADCEPSAATVKRSRADVASSRPQKATRRPSGDQLGWTASWQERSRRSPVSIFTAQSGLVVASGRTGSGASRRRSRAPGRPGTRPGCSPCR